MDNSVVAEGGVELSIVIPVYNAEDSLDTLVSRLAAVLSPTGRRFEILLINDGSQDNSWSVLCDMLENRSEDIVIINLMRNFGQHNAIMCGFRESSGALVVTMDDDLQNLPEEIPHLIAAIDDDQFDIVYGCYKAKKHHPFRNLGSTVTQLFYRVVFGHTNCISAFRIVRRRLVDSVLSYSLNFTYLDGLFAWNTNRIGQIVVKHKRRKSGQSGYSLSKLVILALNLFTNFSLLPLQLVSAVGLIVAISGFGAGAFFLFQHFMQNITVPGYASIIVAIFALGGVQLLALGIIGEYLGRLHLNVNKRPQYVQREIRRTRPKDSQSKNYELAEKSDPPGI